MESRHSYCNDCQGIVREFQSKAVPDLLLGNLTRAGFCRSRPEPVPEPDVTIYLVMAHSECTATYIETRTITITMRSGVLTITSCMQHGVISGCPLPKRMDFGGTCSLHLDRPTSAPASNTLAFSRNVAIKMMIVCVVFVHFES